MGKFVEPFGKTFFFTGIGLYFVYGVVIGLVPAMGAIHPPTEVYISIIVASFVIGVLVGLYSWAWVKEQ